MFTTVLIGAIAESTVESYIYLLNVYG